MQMNTAIRNRVNWSGGNTTVMIDPENADQATVYLHGNRIAQVCSEFVAIFDGGWQSNTTKSRLNALIQEFSFKGGIFQKNFNWYVQMFKTVTPFHEGITLPLIN